PLPEFRALLPRLHGVDALPCAEAQENSLVPHVAREAQRSRAGDPTRPRSELRPGLDERILLLRSRPPSASCVDLTHCVSFRRSIATILLIRLSARELADTRTVFLGF